MVLCAVECIDPIRVRYLLHSSCCCRCSVLANAGVHCRRFPLLYFGRWLIVKYKRILCLLKDVFIFTSTELLFACVSAIGPK